MEDRGGQPGGAIDYRDYLKRYRARLERTLRKVGTHSFDDVVTALERGEAQIWPVESGFFITEILLYPQAKFLRIWLAVGERRNLQQHLIRLVFYGREQGCSRIVMEGRRGWERVLSSPVKHTMSTFTLEI